MASKQLAGQAVVYSTERRTWALHLRARGRSYVQIGREMNITQSTAHKLVKSALQDQLVVLSETADEVRTMELERLDSMLQVLFKRFQDPANANIERTADTIVRLMERRAAYLGLDAPKDFRLGMGGAAGETSEHDAAWELARLSTDELEQLERITSKAHMPGLTQIADVPAPLPDLSPEPEP